MRVACLVSGGKDSIAAANVVAQWGWDIDSFLTLLPQAEAPMLYHRPNAKWVRLQAEAASVPWRSKDVGADASETEALADLLRPLRIDGVVTGAVASEFQRTSFEAVCHGLGLKTFAPLWHHGPERHLQDLIGMGVASILVHAAAAGLDESWLGRPLDVTGVADLSRVAAKHRLNVAGEGGEYETYAVDAPIFAQRIEITKAHATWWRDSGTWMIDSARLVAKRP
jgi:ABC transporter with metal-binding/Fe-S-binding domain ATP-binding protein